MDRKKFNSLLEDAHREIQNAEGVDEKSRQLLSELERDIRGLLERSEDQTPDRPVVARFKQAIDDFATTHPSLTAALSEISNILSNAGI